MKILITVSILLVSGMSYAQHDHIANTARKFDFKPIFNQAFTDSSFAGKAIQMVLLTVPAGANDTVTHRHDCHLIGYVLEGEIITKLKNKPAQHFKKDEVFYEFPNEIHESLQNPDKNHDAKILLYYVFNNGAVLYKMLYEK